MRIKTILLSIISLSAVSAMALPSASFVNEMQMTTNMIARPIVITTGTESNANGSELGPGSNLPGVLPEHTITPPEMPSGPDISNLPERDATGTLPEIKEAQAKRTARTSAVSNRHSN